MIILVKGSCLFKKKSAGYVLCKQADMVLCTIHKIIHKGLLVKARVTGAPLIAEERCLDQEGYVNYLHSDRPLILRGGA